MWAGTKNHNIGDGPLKKPIPKSMPIFGIDHLNTTATNNILLISTGKSTNIGIDYCYQPIPIMNPRCYNISFF
jgi:hypothetical protein